MVNQHSLFSFHPPSRALFAFIHGLYTLHLAFLPFHIYAIQYLFFTTFHATSKARMRTHLYIDLFLSSMLLGTHTDIFSLKKSFKSLALFQCNMTPVVGAKSPFFHLMFVFISYITVDVYTN